MIRQFCHHQGVIYCLAKITIYIIVRAMRSLCYRYVATCQWKECLLERLVSCVVSDQLVSDRIVETCRSILNNLFVFNCF